MYQATYLSLICVIDALITYNESSLYSVAHVFLSNYKNCTNHLFRWLTWTHQFPRCSSAAAPWEAPTLPRRQWAPPTACLGPARTGRRPTRASRSPHTSRGAAWHKTHVRAVTLWPCFQVSTTAEIHIRGRAVCSVTVVGMIGVLIRRKHRIHNKIEFSFNYYHQICFNQ